MSVQAGRGYAVSSSPGKENGPATRRGSIAQVLDSTNEFIRTTRASTAGRRQSNAAGARAVVFRITRGRAYFFFAGFVAAPFAVPLNGLGGSATPRSAAELAPFAFVPFVFATGAATTGAAGVGGSFTGSLVVGLGASVGGAGAGSGGGAAVAADAVAIFARGSSAVPNATSAAVATTTAAVINATPRRAASRGGGATSASDMRDRFIGRGGGNDSGANTWYVRTPDCSLGMLGRSVVDSVVDVCIANGVGRCVAGGGGGGANAAGGGGGGANAGGGGGGGAKVDFGAAVIIDGGSGSGDDAAFVIAAGSGGGITGARGIIDAGGGGTNDDGAAIACGASGARPGRGGRTAPALLCPSASENAPMRKLK